MSGETWSYRFREQRGEESWPVTTVQWGRAEAVIPSLSELRGIVSIELARRVVDEVSEALSRGAVTVDDLQTVALVTEFVRRFVVHYESSARYELSVVALSRAEHFASV